MSKIKRPTQEIAVPAPGGVNRATSRAYEYIKAVGGDTVILDVGKLPIGRETYTANVAWMEHEGTTVSFMFGNRDRDDRTKLKTRVELRFAVEAFLNAWENSKPFYERLGAIIAEHPFLAYRAEGEPLPRKMAAQKDHTAPASVTMMTQAGSQAEVGFFDLPATRVFMYQKTQDLAHLEVMPVLRVFTPTGLLHKVLSECEQIAKEMQSVVSITG